MTTTQSLTKIVNQVVNQVATIENMLLDSCGEVTPEIADMLAIKEVNLPDKVDSYAAVIERFGMLEEYYKEKAANILKIAKSASAIVERCKANLEYAMQELKLDEISGNESRFKLVHSNPSVIIADETKVEDIYKTTETTVKINKKSILEDLKMGLEVAGCKMQENVSLRKYAAKAGSK